MSEEPKKTEDPFGVLRECRHPERYCTCNYDTIGTHRWADIQRVVRRRLIAAAVPWSFNPSEDDLDEALARAKDDLTLPPMAKEQKNGKARKNGRKGGWQDLESSAFDEKDPTKNFNFAVTRATRIAKAWLWDEHWRQTTGFYRPPSHRKVEKAKPDPCEGKVKDGLTHDEWNELYPFSLGFQAPPVRREEEEYEEEEYVPWHVREQHRILRLLVDTVLPDDEQAVVRSIFWGGLSLTDTAALIGRTSNHPARKRLVKALARLREWLGGVDEKDVDWYEVEKNVQQFVDNYVESATRCKNNKRKASPKKLAYTVQHPVTGTRTVRPDGREAG